MYQQVWMCLAVAGKSVADIILLVLLESLLDLFQHKTCWTLVQVR